MANNHHYYSQVSPTKKQTKSLPSNIIGFDDDDICKEKGEKFFIIYTHNKITIKKKKILMIFKNCPHRKKK